MKKQTEEGLKLLKAEIKNFKNISYKEVDFEGKSAIILGKNNAGKSSFLQAIESPMDSKYIPLKPVKEGEEHGEIEIEVGGILNGEMTRYKLAVYFSPEHQKGRIKVYDADGAEIKSGKSIIESIVGNVGFDIFDFVKKSRTDTGRPSAAGLKEQIETLKQLMPHEGVVELDQLDIEIELAYNSRTEINAQVKNLEETSKHDLTQEDIDKYSKELPTAEVKEKITSLSDEVEKWNKIKEKHTDNEELLVELPLSIEEKEKELKKLKEALAEAQEKKPKYDKYFKKNPEKPSIDSLTKELEEINNHNDVHKEIKKLEESNENLRKKKEGSKSLTDAILVMRDEKKEVFAKYPLPVKGLAFDEENITYKGLPLHDDQINTATLITIGAKISMAMNPNLRLIIIKDGSLLDKDGIDLILKVCDKHNYQVLIEKVSDEGEGVEVKFVEK